MDEMRALLPEIESLGVTPPTEAVCEIERLRDNVVTRLAGKP